MNTKTQKEKRLAMLLIFIFIGIDFLWWLIFNSPITLYACGFCSGILVTMILKDD